MRSSFARHMVAGIRMIVLMTVVLGVVYPLAFTAFAQVAVNDRADGQLVEFDGKVVGSRLIGQTFTAPTHFHSRPSAVDYDGASSGGSNLGPTDPALLDLVEARIRDYRELNGLSDDVAIPVDAVTASGSGLDPDISPANALLQANRVAEANGVDVDVIVGLIGDNTEHRPLGILGDDAVNVLELNIAVDEL